MTEPDLEYRKYRAMRERVHARRRNIRKLTMMVLLVLLRAFRELPRPVAFAFAQVFGGLFYLFGGKYLKRAGENIRHAFTGKTGRERRALLKGVCRNIARVFVEYIMFAQYPDRFSQEFVDTTEPDRVIADELKKGRGVIVLSAHCGPWEILGSYGCRVLGATIVVQKLRLSGLNAYVEDFRRKLGFNTVENDKTLGMLKVLKRNGVLAVLPDLYIRHFRGDYYDFFGRKAFMTLGPTSLSLATGAPIVPTFIVRRGKGYYVKCYEPIDYTPTGDKQKDIDKLTRMWVKVIEDHIRSAPEQWMWLNDRWREHRGAK